jgi:tetraacyldisaccharide 4'-kinase
MVAEEARRRGKLVLRARIEPEPQAASALKGRRVLAFAGIGRPDKFFGTLEQAGATVVRRIGFADHHAYTREEFLRLVAEARRENLSLLTTEKDLVRIAALGDASLSGIAALPVALSFERSQDLLDLVRARIAGVRNAAHRSP